MSTYIQLPDEVLFNSSNLAVELEDELSERFISGEISESEYRTLKMSIDDWLKSTRRAIGIYRNIHRGEKRMKVSRTKEPIGSL